MKNIKIVSIYLLSLYFVTACGGGDGAPNIGADTDTVSVTISLDKLASTVTYNKAATPDGRLEFNWGVTFDINGDGAINQGDIELRLMHFKAPGSIETTGPISDFQADLWLFTSDTRADSVAVASTEISGNSITISIAKSEHSTLTSISDATLVYFSTTNINDVSGIQEEDYYPGFSTLVNIPANKQFTDIQGDVSQPEIDMVSMSLAF